MEENSDGKVFLSCICTFPFSYQHVQWIAMSHALTRYTIESCTFDVEAIMSDLVSAVAVVSSKSPAPTNERYISYSLPYAHLYILCQRNTNANLVTRFVSIHTVRVTEEYRYPL